MCARVRACLHVGVGTLRPEDGAWFPGAAEFQAVVCYPVWILGTDLGFCARAVRALNCWAVAPAPWLYFLKVITSVLSTVCPLLWSMCGRDSPCLPSLFVSSAAASASLSLSSGLFYHIVMSVFLHLSWLKHQFTLLFLCIDTAWKLGCVAGEGPQEVTVGGLAPPCRPAPQFSSPPQPSRAVSLDWILTWVSQEFPLSLVLRWLRLPVLDLASTGGGGAPLLCLLVSSSSLWGRPGQPPAQPACQLCSGTALFCSCGFFRI